MEPAAVGVGVPTNSISISSDTLRFLRAPVTTLFEYSSSTSSPIHPHPNEDTMVRQAAMTLKLLLLMYYKNGRQGQMLTLVEYALLLYRAFLPAPVWYRFFLNKEYGSLFSSLITGLYLTFKLTSVVEKIGSFYAALKALSPKEMHYGSYATSEQVSEAGDMCAICQEKMQAPVLLCCNHIFCEDCVSEWFERERTCPLCRALVRPADIRSFGDGSTTLFFRLF